MNRSRYYQKKLTGLLLLTSALSLASSVGYSQDDGEDEEIFELSPFEVTADDSTGYKATSTLAGTRIKTDLKDVASALSVVTSQFLKDTGAKNSQDLLVYTTNTEVGGITGNFSGAGGASTYNENSNLLRPSQNTRVRGLDSADNTRDFFLSDIPWDGYIVDRVDLQRGPNSILFGVGSPSGIINTNVNTAIFDNSSKIENRIGKFGSIRNSFDINRTVIEDTLAIRVAGLLDHTKYQQSSTYNKDKRLFGAIRYEPDIFGDNSHTTIRANYETGSVTANRPRSLPPVDAITPWFESGTSNGYQNLNKLTLNPNTTWNEYGANDAYPGSTYPWFREAFMGRLMSSNIAFYHDSDNSEPLLTQMPNVGTEFGIGGDGNVDTTIDAVPFARPWGIATYNNYARLAVPGGKYYSNISISNPEIFDFYNKLMDGDNKSEWQNWNAHNISLSQTFLNDRIGFEYVNDVQNYDDGQLAFLQGDQFQISVDINTHLLDGSPNPNVGRPYVANSGQYGNSENYINRNSDRFTAFAELRADDFLEEDSLLANILGTHLFTGLMSKDEKSEDNRGFSRWATTTDFTDVTGGVSTIINGARQIDWVSYIGDDLRNASSPAVNLSPVTATINPTGSATVRYFNSHWNATGVDPSAPYSYVTYNSSGAPETTVATQSENPANYVGWTNGTFPLLNYDNPADRSSLYSSGSRSVNEIKSTALVWQGKLFNGAVVPTYGWRKDEVTNTSATAPKGVNGESLMDYQVNEADALRVEGQSRSWGIMVHTPREWQSILPGNTHFSFFYNESENFKADAPRGDVFGNKIDNPIGNTQDYGFLVSSLDDRLSLKVNWYETKVQNASLQADSAGFSGNLYYAWAIGYWGTTHALAALDGIADPQLRQGNWGWPWNNIATNEDGSPNNARIREIAEAWFKNFPFDQTWADEYGLDLNVAAMKSANTDAERYASLPSYDGAANLGLQPAYGGNLGSTGKGPVASVDTTSKGVEIEANAQLTKNWNLLVNVSKTEASRTAISPTIDTWIEDVTEFLATDAGLVTIWGGDPFRVAWDNNIIAPYEVLKAQIGSSAPEVAPWRFNAITNYSFSDGAFSGTNVGLAYRWEDKRILGYQYDADLDALDISKPWMGPTDAHFDMWVGYSRELSDKIDWHVQLNLRNIGEETNLVPVNMQPDGSIALSRIKEGMTWQLTNTFTF